MARSPQSERTVSQRLSIGFLATGLSAEDGWNRYAKAMVETLSTHVEVTTLVARGSRNESSQSVVETLSQPRFTLFSQLQVCIACLRYLRSVEIIHALVEPYAPGAALAARLMGKRFVMTLHGTYSVPPSILTVHGFLLRFAYATTTTTTTGSFGTEEKVRASGARLPECRFIPNGVDDKVFTWTNEVREPFFMTVGEIKPRKGADLGVRALAILKDEFPKMRYKIVGNYSSNSFVDEIHNIAKEGGVAGRVEFTGRVDDAALVRLYNRCSAFVLAARDEDGHFEGFPMVYYEANACGAPVVTTTGFGSEYAIRPGINGLLVPAENPEELAGALRRIFANDAFAKTLSHGALQEAQRHTWGQIAPQLLAWYNDAHSKVL